MKLRLKKFKSVRSTNDVAIKLIKKKNPQPTLIISEKQTRGRGTMGKNGYHKKGTYLFQYSFS